MCIILHHGVVKVRWHHINQRKKNVLYIKIEQKCAKILIIQMADRTILYDGNHFEICKIHLAPVACCCTVHTHTQIHLNDFDSVY